MTHLELLRHLGDSLGLAALTAWQADECVLTIDGMAVRMRHLREAGQVEIEAALFHESPLEWEDAAAMLAANFVGAGAADAICNLGPDGVPRLSMRHSIESLCDDHLVSLLERFVARLERHRRPSTTTPAATATVASAQWQEV